MNVSIKILRLVFHIISGVGKTVFHSTLLNRSFSQEKYHAAIQQWLKSICQILVVDIKVTGEPAKACLQVSNHISWLDIPVLASVNNPRFLSKAEVRHWPIIGWLAECSGTLFIQRGNAKATQGVRQGLSSSLQNGDTVLIFPEGTTTDGESVRRFHPRLFAAAIETNTHVQPIMIRYPALDDAQKINAIVPYIDEQSLGDNLKQLLQQKKTIVHVHYCPLINITGKDRKQIALESEQAIRESLAQAFHETASR
jgi:1-acyl-sn-glycerol-3-phosphate acyltransferase